MPERIRHLVYLDSLMVDGGKSPFDSLPADVVAARRKAAEETSGGLSVSNPPPSAFGVSDEKDAEWDKRRLTPHPLGAYTSTLNIKGPVGNNLPRTYIHCASACAPRIVVLMDSLHRGGTESKNQFVPIEKRAMQGQS